MESKLNGIKMRKFETKEELVEWIETMHLQNTSGRETEEEMFRLGIEAAIEELTEFNLFSIPVVVGRSEQLVCPDCKDGRDPFDPDWLCPECRQKEKEAYLMINAYGKIEAEKVAIGYANDCIKEINELKHYCGEKIKRMDDRKWYWLTVASAIKNWT